jgi:predicted metal-dependent hydrolase
VSLRAERGNLIGEDYQSYPPYDLFLDFISSSIRESLPMAKSNIIEIDGVGPVLFERSKRAKHLIIHVKPATGVRVAIPYGVSVDKAERIVYSKINWIQKQQAKIAKIRQKYGSLLMDFERINKTAARRKLIHRLEELADWHGFSYNKVFIRNQKTRWGSCSASNNINLNMKLALLPDELIDYVILHELLHTRIKNHSREFWTELDRLVGNAKHYAKQLKEYGLGL